MAEYIKRDDAICAVCRTQCDRDEPCGGVVCDVIDALRHKVPAADVAPVRHGRWEWKRPNGWACTNCGEWGLCIDSRGIHKSAYCPNCGARMEVEEAVSDG